MSLDFTKANSFRIGKDETRIDFLTKIAGVTFDEADLEKVLLPLDEGQIPVINYHHLITNKLSSTRLKDLAEAEELQKINQYKNKK